MTIFSWLSILVSMSLLLVAWRSFFVAQKTTRLTIINNLRQEWNIKQPIWATVLLIVRGSNDYYTLASMEQASIYREKEEQLASDPNYNEKNWELYRQEYRPIHDITNFIGYVMELVLAGHINTQEVYFIFGPEVARQRGVLQKIAGYETPLDDMNIPSPEAATWEVGSMGGSAFAHQNELISLFAEIIWAEHAKRGDTYLHRVLEYAKETSHLQDIEEMAELLTYGKPRKVKKQITETLSYSSQISTTAILRMKKQDKMDIVPSVPDHLIRKDDAYSKYGEKIRQENG